MKFSLLSEGGFPFHQIIFGCKTFSFIPNMCILLLCAFLCWLGGVSPRNPSVRWLVVFGGDCWLDCGCMVLAMCELVVP